MATTILYFTFTADDTFIVKHVRPTTLLSLQKNTKDDTLMKKFTDIMKALSVCLHSDKSAKTEEPDIYKITAKCIGWHNVLGYT